MAIKLKVPSEHVSIADEFGAAFVYLKPELATWLKEKDAQARVTHRMFMNPHTFQYVPFALIEFQDETVAIEYKLRWL